MNIKKAATSTIAAGFVGAALLGLGVSAGTASAAPQQQPSNSAQTHQQQEQAQQLRAQQLQREQSQRVITITRPNYRPFNYRGQRVTPRYNAAHREFGFTYNGTFVHVVLSHR